MREEGTWETPEGEARGGSRTARGKRSNWNGDQQSMLFI